MKIKNIIIGGLVAALAACSATPAIAASTAPELLQGLPSDYEVIGGVIPRNTKTGEMGRAANTNGYIFIEMRYRIVNGKLVPSYPLPTSTSSSLPPQDQKDLELGRAVRGLVR